jgi:hypothetical protein
LAAEKLNRTSAPAETDTLWGSLKKKGICAAQGSEAASERKAAKSERSTVIQVTTYKCCQYLDSSGARHSALTLAVIVGYSRGNGFKPNPLKSDVRIRWTLHEFRIAFGAEISSHLWCKPVTSSAYIDLNCIDTSSSTPHRCRHHKWNSYVKSTFPHRRSAPNRKAPRNESSYSSFATCAGVEDFSVRHAKIRRGRFAIYLPQCCCF